MQRGNSLEKTLMLGKIKGKRRRGQQRTRWLDSITNLMVMNVSELWETVEDRGACHAIVHGVSKIWTQQHTWNLKYAQMNLSARQKLACRHRDQDFLLPKVREGGRMMD